MTRITLFVLIGAILVVTSLLACAQTGTTAPPASPSARTTLRVGTFDPRIVALAYSRSPDQMKARNKWLTDLKTQRDAALKAGDTKKAAAIEAQGAAAQEKAHVQVFLGEQLDDILFDLKPAFPKIAQAAGVDLVVSQPLFQAPDAQTVDLTDAIVDHIGADETTRKFIADMKKQPPIPHGTKIKD